MKEYVSKVDGREDLLGKLANLDQNEKVRVYNSYLVAYIVHG